MHTIHTISSEKYWHKFAKKKRGYGCNLHDTKTCCQKIQKKSMKEFLIIIYIPKTSLIFCLKQRSNWTKKKRWGWRFDLTWRQICGPIFKWNPTWHTLKCQRSDTCTMKSIEVTCRHVIISQYMGPIFLHLLVPPTGLYLSSIIHVD